MSARLTDLARSIKRRLSRVPVAHQVVDAVQAVVESPILTREPAPLIEYIAADIVNNCNLRCPFCVVDYSTVKKTELMTEETFRSLLRLAPVVRENTFWLSCLHEPTLHPKLGEFIGMIPAEDRRKFWFTTNLARPLPDDLVQTLATSRIHHINVSFDTMDDERFAVLRKGGRYKVFRENLDRVVAAFGAVPDAPKIRYITMAYRSNLHEIPDMVRFMNESALGWEVEIRYTYNVAHIPDSFRAEQFLTRAEWEQLDAGLRAQPYRNYILVPPPDEAAEAEQPAANWFEMYPIKRPPQVLHKRPLPLRVRPDGRILLSGNEFAFTVNINELEDPIAYLREISAEP